MAHKSSNKWDNPNDKNGVLKVEKKAKINKQGLSRYALATRELKDGETVFCFDEETELVSPAKVSVKNNETILKDEKGFMIRFIDIIFRTEREATQYKNAPFM